jgi:predicted metal-dependent enzyme (double-stranded beta helix superfamily)
MPKKTRTPASPAAIAARLADRRSLWQGLVRYDPISRYHARIAAEPEFEAWLLTWLPGQGTEWHDHGGSAGAFVTVQGNLSEKFALVAPEQPPRIAAVSRDLPTGTLRAFGAKHIHRVTNPGREPAVSVHVYSPSLREMHYYHAEGDLLSLSHAELAGVNW